MNYSKIGKFIKSLREGKNWSQETLANKLHCERTKINRIENGKRYVKIEDLILLSELFEVSLEELIAGEKKNTKNKEEIQITFKEFIRCQNSKIQKMRIMSIILIILLVSIFSIFTIFYFFQNYKTIRIYKFSGTSENYEINDGLLILSKDKIYLKVENIVPTVDKISIYREQDNKQTLIYAGNSNVILKDNYGYSSIVSYKDFIKSKQTIFIVINDERIDLNFKEEFVNDAIFYQKEETIGETRSYSFIIPQEIKKNFECEEDFCHLELENEKLLFNNGILSVTKNEEYFLYDVNNNVFEYQNSENSKINFVVLVNDNEINCVSGTCKNSKKIYEEFYNSYILQYLN